MDTQSTSAPIWVLLGKRRGDNQQLLAIAEALQLPFRTITQRFNWGAKIHPALRGASHLGWDTHEPLEAPWPRIVLGAGRRSVPMARWIRRRSGGYTKLVYVNRPWAPLSWFDLIITTPQYALPARPNVLSNLMPFLPPQADSPPKHWEPASAAVMPRPWTAVLIGGPSQPYVYSDDAARAMAATINKQVAATGGSAWVLDSPRTPPHIMPLLRQSLNVPSQLVHWRGEGRHAYPALLASADRFIVTEDSASMTTEALLTDKPVSLLELPIQPNWKRRLASKWRVAAERAPESRTAQLFETAIGLGLLTAVRDLRLLHGALRHAGLFGGSNCPTAWAERERQATLAHITRLIEDR